MKKVLIADDDDTIREAISYTLSVAGHKIYKAGNGAEAIEIFKLNPEIEIVILDLRMPVMDGHEACDLLKRLKPEIEIIISSAFIDEAVTKELCNCGIKHILCKPYDLTVLHEIIDNSPGTVFN
ncbi:MAG: response regulator [Nitrospirae bacterium]|nr:response regulator [Nitrospirota bacterium]